MDYITPIKKELDKQMTIYSELYLRNGQEYQTPRYFNFDSFDMETKILTIGSTQRSYLKFQIQTEFPFVEVHEFWNQFKEYRTEFLKKNFEMIKRF